MFQAIEMGREGKKFTGGHGACQFKLTYYKQRRKKKVDNDDCAVQPRLWKLAKNQTLLQHSPHCPGVLKLKVRQLVAHPGFRNQVSLFSCFLFLASSFYYVYCVFPIIYRLFLTGKPAWPI
jgi:hypothetical protein